MMRKWKGKIWKRINIWQEKKNKGVRNREESREGERTRAKVKGKKNKNNKSLKKKAAKSERRWIDQ